MSDTCSLFRRKDGSYVVLVIGNSGPSYLTKGDDIEGATDDVFASAGDALEYVAKHYPTTGIMIVVGRPTTDE